MSAPAAALNKVRPHHPTQRSGQTPVVDFYTAWVGCCHEITDRGRQVMEAGPLVAKRAVDKDDVGRLTQVGDPP